MMTTVFIKMLEDWVQEAVACHGDDWTAIYAFVEDKLAGLTDPQRTDLAAQLALLLAASHDRPSPSPN